jgi:hypothetical protein
MDAAWLPRVTLPLLLLAVPAAHADPLPAGRVLPLAVRDGRCECTLPTPTTGEQYYLVLGSLARQPGPFPVTVRTEAVAGPAAVPLEAPAPDDGWVRRVDDQRARLARAWRNAPATPGYAASADPPRQHTFYVFVGDQDFQDPAGYVPVPAVLRAVGRCCQVYVDQHAADPAALQPTVDDVVKTFDEDVYPRACRILGQPLDVDRDGRFTILLTDWLGKLQHGKVSLGGFVRGSDFYRDLRAPYGNRCDMMYLNTDLQPGPHLRTLLAHEFTHAVIFSEHVFGDYLPEAPHQDEEGWLNEGLAHLAEDLHGHGWSNLDYRVSAYLSAPERYQLVVPDYYAAGLWRNPGNRGSAYLFLRWVADRQGDGLARQMVRTNLSGVANLEATTRERFPELFRQWSAALLQSGSGVVADGFDPLQRLDLRKPLAGRLLCGPRFHAVPLAGGAEEVRLAGTGVGYVLLHSPAATFSRVTVTADRAAELQVSLVRLPAQTGRLGLRVEPDDRPGAIRLVLTAYGSQLTVDEAAWERLAPVASRQEDTSFRADEPAGQTARGWFGEGTLRPGESRTSPGLTVPAGEAGVFKVSATDAAGHRLAAWAVVDGTGGGR